MDPRDRLFGEIAVRLQLLSREQVGACMRAQLDAHAGKRLGEVACSLGFMAQTDVDLVLSQQARVLDRRRDGATDKPRTAAEGRSARRDARLDATVPLAAAADESGVARPEDYEFDKPAAPSTATIAGPAHAPSAGATRGKTMLEGAGAAPREPIDRGWRNPSRPPVTAPTLAPRPLPEATSLAEMLALARRSGASDLHLHTGAGIHARIDGVLAPLAGAASLSHADTEQLVVDLLTEAQRSVLERTGEVRCAHVCESGGRSRVQATRHLRGLSAVLHLVACAPASLEDLALPSRLHKLADAPRGLLLFSGPSGSGKSSTLAALLADLACSRPCHVVSVEDPIEIVHTEKRGALVQCEVPTHVRTMAEGIAFALAQGAQIVAASEITDAACAKAVLRAADAGVLVLATIRADSGAGAIEHMLDLLGADARARHAVVLADSLRLLTYQTLLPQTMGRGRVPAVEVIVGTPQVASAIASDAIDRLGEAVRLGKSAGMTSHASAVSELLDTGVIPALTAHE